MDVTDLVDVQGLVVVRGSFRLEVPSWRVAPGQVVGIVGPNGAGKTTLLEAVAGLRPVDGGSLRVFGLEPWKRPVEVRSALGFMSDDSGYFLQAWSVLPIERQRVTRAVYFHVLLASAIVWLVGCAQIALRGGGPGFPVFELPAVFLAGAILLCEAVGDRTRGLLAVACLVGFQMVLPVAFVFLDTTLTAGRRFALDGPTLTVAGYALGLLGGLPPLVHLRRGGSR